MATVRVILAPDGTTHVDIGLPIGDRCAAVDAQLRAILAALGTPLTNVTEDPTARPKQPEVVAVAPRVKVGGGSQ